MSANYYDVIQNSWHDCIIQIDDKSCFKLNVAIIERELLKMALPLKEENESDFDVIKRLKKIDKFRRFCIFIFCLKRSSCVPDIHCTTRGHTKPQK